MFVDYAVSKDCINIHSLAFPCADCLKGYRCQSKSNDMEDWIMCGIRNLCSEEDTSNVQEMAISKFCKEKPTMKQRMDFIKKYRTYNVIQKPRKECPF